MDMTDKVEFEGFKSKIEKQFIGEGYLSLERSQNEKKVLLMSACLNPLNISYISDHNLNNILVEAIETKITNNGEYKRQKVNYKDKEGSEFFGRIIIVVQEESIESFVSTLLESYNQFKMEYFQNTESYRKLYDKFNVISYWKCYKWQNNRFSSILKGKVKKYLCIESTEIYCETTFKYAKLCKNDLRRRLSNTSLSNLMVLLNKKFVYDSIKKKFK